MIMLNHKLKTVSNSRVVSKSDYFSGEYSQHLWFSVIMGFNNLILDKKTWSDEVISC